MHAHIRMTIAGLFGADVAKEVRILYGGSVKPENAQELLQRSDIDGALVGGASLQADSFASIVKAAKS
jgi:triosephosphate isomerase